MSMSKDEVIARIKADGCTKVHRETGLPYRYLRNLVDDEIKNPGSRQMDILRSHFSKKPMAERRA